MMYTITCYIQLRQNGIRLYTEKYKINLKLSDTKGISLSEVNTFAKLILKVQ